MAIQFDADFAMIIDGQRTISPGTFEFSIQPPKRSLLASLIAPASSLTEPLLLRLGHSLTGELNPLPPEKLFFWQLRIGLNCMPINSCP